MILNDWQKTLVFVSAILVAPVLQAGNVLPDQTTRVPISNTDVNRIVCQDGDISDVIYSVEKGITVKVSGKNAWVKLKMLKQKDKLLYNRKPVDISVVCAGQVYTLVGTPAPIPIQTIRLGGYADKARKNVAMMQGMPHEKRILFILEHLYKDDYPDSWTVQTTVTPLGELGAGLLDLVREIDIEGVGLRAKVLRFKALRTAEIEETDFLQSGIGKQIVAVSIDQPKLSSGEVTRVFILEKNLDE